MRKGRKERDKEAQGEEGGGAPPPQVEEVFASPLTDEKFREVKN